MKEARWIKRQVKRFKHKKENYWGKRRDTTNWRTRGGTQKHRTGNIGKAKRRNRVFHSKNLKQNERKTGPSVKEIVPFKGKKHE